MFKEIFKKNKWLILSILILLVGSFLVIGQSWAKGVYYIGGGDVKTQWYPFYILCRRAIVNAIKNRVFPFYSWVLFLGNNIWASKSSYGLFDIYNLCSLVLNGNYFEIYNILCVLKIVVSGISCYVLINYIYKNSKVSMIAGVLYGLSSYAIYFTSQPGFLSFYSLVPLYFLGIELYLKQNGKYLFIITTFVMLLMNFYLFYAISIFSPIYFIYRYYLTKRELKGVVISALKLIGYYLVGVLLSAFVIVPVFMYVIQNQRIGQSTPLTYAEFHTYLHLFFASFIPNELYIYKNNVFDDGAHNLKEICMYAGTICSLLVPQVFFNKDKQFKTATIIVYVLMLICLFVPTVSAAINGFSSACFRWVFFFILMNIFVTAYYLINPQEINKKVLLITLIVESVIVTGMFFLALNNRGFIFVEYKKQFTIIISYIAIMILCALLILKRSKLLYLFICIEMLIPCLLNGINPMIISDETLKNVTNVISNSDDPNSLMNYLNGLDEDNNYEYFRTYIPYNSLYWCFSHDLSIIYNINDLMSYDSMYAPSFSRMKDIDYDGVVYIINWEYDIQNPDIIKFLSTKYSITVSEDEIPFENYKIVDDAYRVSFIVAENLDYRPLVTTYTKYISYDEFLNSNKDTSMLNNYVISDTDVSEYLGNTVSEIEGVSYYNNYLSGTLETEEDGFAVMSIPYDAGWKITINGERIDYIECNGGMIGFSVNQGINYIEMYFIPEGFKLGCILTGIGGLSFLALVANDLIKRKKNNLKTS